MTVRKESGSESFDNSFDRNVVASGAALEDTVSNPAADAGAVYYANTAVADAPNETDFEADTTASVALETDFPRSKRFWRWSILHIPFTLNIEVLLYAVLLIVAIATRFWDLGSRALDHDEGVHAYYSWLLYHGGGYQQEPWKHGPFLYHVTALVFWLFGSGVATARVPAAFFGVLIMLLPIFLRKELGRWGALTASFLLTISPLFLYYTRFIREDVFVTFSVFLLFIGLVRFIAKPRAIWWYVSMLSLGLLYCTKEVSFFYTAILFGFLFLWMCWQFAPRLLLIFAVYAAFALFIFGFVLKLATPPAIPFSDPTQAGNYISQLIFHPVFITFVVLSIIGVCVVFFSLREVAESRRQFLIRSGRIDPIIGPAAALFLPYEEGTVAYAVGWLGRHWKVTGAGLGFAFAFYAIFFTSFFSYPVGFFGLIYGLFYWLAQQGVARGSQPWYYYAFLLPLYEPLEVAFGMISAAVITVGAIRDGFRRRTTRKLVPALDLSQLDDENSENNLNENATMVEIEVAESEKGNALWPNRRKREPHPYFVPLFLVFLTFSSFAIYTWASEKMPWLAMELALPFILLTAMFFNPIWNTLDEYVSTGRNRELSLLGLPKRFYFWGLIVSTAFFLVAIYTMVLIDTAVAGNAIDTPWAIAVAVVGAIAVGFFAMFAFGSRERWEIRSGFTVLAAVVFFLMSYFLMHTGFAFSYDNGDTPIEMGMYSQVSPDVPHLMAQIKNFSTIMPENYALPMLYDTELQVPFQFYLRDYTATKMISDFKPESLAGEGVTSINSYPIVMVINWKTDQLGTALQNYVPYHYTLRWFFNEDLYRNFAQTTTVEKQQLLNQASKITLNDSTGKPIVTEGQTMTQQILDTADTDHLLDELYNGNGHSVVGLNLNLDLNSTVDLFNGKNMQNLWRFVFFREQSGQFWGVYDFTVYVRKDVVGLWRQYSDLVPTNIDMPQ